VSRRLALFGFAAILLCGCGSHAAQEGHRATLAEVRWVGKLDRWYRPSPAFARDCSQSLFAAVGHPPTKWLEPSWAGASAACRHFERAAASSSTDDVASVRAEFKKGLVRMSRVSKALQKVRPGTAPLRRTNGASSASRIALRYTSALVTTTSDVRVVVRCWSLTDWNRVLRRFSAYAGRSEPDVLGFTIKPDDIDLSPRVCKALDALTYGHARPKDRASLAELAIGVNTLSHESQHVVHPGKNEAVIECDGLQALSGVAQFLGADEPYGKLLARTYYRDVYPRQPAAYRSPFCYNGGPLDRRRWDPLWP
jgi:hypothetical protein